MAAKQRGLSLSLALILLLGAFSSPLAASELSDAEMKLTDLQRKYESELGFLLLIVPGYEGEAQECIRRLTGSTNSADVITRVACEQELARVQSEKNTKSRLVEELKAEISVLESKVQTLGGSGGSTQSSGSASSSSGGSTISSAQSATSPTASSSTQTSDPQSSQSTADNSATASPAPTPSLSSPPSAVFGSKVSATPKPVVKKKKTIKCYKGKSLKKVTAVKPKCPKGYKVKIR
jgi:hypothetical protein